MTSITEDVWTQLSRLAGGSEGGAAAVRTAQPFPKSSGDAPEEPAAPPLGTHTKELNAGSSTENGKPRFTAALFTAGKRRKPERHPSADEGINKIQSVGTGETTQLYEGRTLHTSYNTEEPRGHYAK